MIKALHEKPQEPVYRSPAETDNASAPEAAAQTPAKTDGINSTDLATLMAEEKAENELRKLMEEKSKQVLSGNLVALEEFIDNTPRPGIPLSDESSKAVKKAANGKDYCLARVNKFPPGQLEKENAILKKYFPDAKVVEAKGPPPENEPIIVTIGVDYKTANAVLEMEYKKEKATFNAKELHSKILAITNGNIDLPSPASPTRPASTPSVQAATASPVISTR